MKIHINSIIPFSLRRKVGNYIDNSKLATKIGISKREKANKFIGFFTNWEDALKVSFGYDTKLIFEKVKQAALKVRDGKALFERDSVLYYDKIYNWSLLAILLKIASERNNRLDLVDFGGSLGSVYFQHKEFLNCLKQIKWNIIEQEHFVTYGKKHFSNSELNFYYDLEECMKKETPDVLLASSFIEYVKDPFAIITKVMNAGFEYLIFDRTSFIEAIDHKILVQKVSPMIYDASYPLWAFNYHKFIRFFAKKYDLIISFDSYCHTDIFIDNFRLYWKGILLRKKRKQLL